MSLQQTISSNMNPNRLSYINNESQNYTSKDFERLNEKNLFWEDCDDQNDDFNE